MAYLNGTVILFPRVLSAFVRVLMALACALLVAAAVVFLTNCGSQKPDARVRQEQAEFMHKQAVNTNRGINDMWKAEKGAYAPPPPPAAAPAPQPKRPSLPTTVQRAEAK